MAVGRLVHLAADPRIECYATERRDHSKYASLMDNLSRMTTMEVRMEREIGVSYLDQRSLG